MCPTASFLATGGLVLSYYLTKFHDFSMIIQFFFKFNDFSMHGTFFSDFPGFTRFPELVGTLHSPQKESSLCCKDEMDKTHIDYNPCK